MKKALLESALRTDFRSFFRKAFAELHSGDMPENARYIDVICDFLESFDSGEFRRGIINLPPRHLKTVLCTVCLSAWILGRKPATRIMIVTYGEELSRDIGDKIRHILRSTWYTAVFPTRLSSDRYQVTDFTTQQGGGVLATSFGGAITGRGADRIIVDDPVKVAEAANIAVHDRVAEVFVSEIMNRLNQPKTGKILIVGHRLHPDDLSGRFAGKPGWHQLVLPFIADEPACIEYGTKKWKRKVGELLRPEGFSEDQVEELRAIDGSPDFETLFQQNPRGVPWAELTDDSFPKYYAPIPDTCPLLLSIDPAHKTHRKASYSVIQAWCQIGENWVLVDQWREHADFEHLKEAAARFSNCHRPSVVLVEATSVGRALAEYLRRRPHRAVVQIDPGTQSKLERLKGCLRFIIDGRVQIKGNAPFRDQFVEEFVSFPHGDFDDQVDATTQFLNYMATSSTIPARMQRAISNLSTYTGISANGFATQVYESGGRAIVASKMPPWRR